MRPDSIPSMEQMQYIDVLSFAERHMDVNNQGMPAEKLSFRELVEAAAKPYKELWKSDGTLNLNALVRKYEKNGHPIAIASFSRLLAKKQKQNLGERVIEATHAVLKIPKTLLRNEPLSAEMEGALSKAKLSTILLAERIEALPKDDYFAITGLIQTLENNQELIREAIKDGSVTPIDRVRSRK